MSSVYEYASVLEDAVEMSSLTELLTVNESYFFRDSAQFTVIRERILPAYH